MNTYLSFASSCRITFQKSKSVLLQQAFGIKQSIEEKLGFPPKPKKPLTPFFRYQCKVRPQLVQQYPNASSQEIVKLAAKHWEKVEPNIKEEYEKEFRSEQGGYVQAMAKYNQSLTDDQISAVKKTRLAIREHKEKLALKKKMRELGRPKRPPSGFILYALSRQSGKGTRDFKGWQLQIAQDWENLPEAEKEKFNIESRDLMNKYLSELRSWEEKMIKEGHIDVVRHEALIEVHTSGKHKVQKSTGNE